MRTDLKRPPVREDIILEACNVSVRFRGLTALDDVTLQLQPGTVSGLVGPNGAGKTTLVNVLSGLLRPTSGSVRYEGAATTRWGLGAASRAGVARTFQASTVFPTFSVLETIQLAISVARTALTPEEVLSVVGLGHRVSSQADNLSYGELRRLGVAIAMATNPKVLLMDEPGAGLTGADLDDLRDVVHLIRDTGTTVLLIDHNMRFLMETVDRVIVLQEGRLIADGTPREVQDDPAVVAAYLGGEANARG